MASVTRENNVKDLGQITARLSKVEATVERARSKSAALSRAAAETVQKSQDNPVKQHAEFEVKTGATHSDLVKSHTIHSENIAKVVRDAQDAFDKARTRHEETATQAQGWSLRADVSIQKNTEAIGKVVPKVVELEQKIARGPQEEAEKPETAAKSHFSQTRVWFQRRLGTRPRT